VKALAYFIAQGRNTELRECGGGCCCCCCCDDDHHDSELA
jgi:hypothetical protein